MLDTEYVDSNVSVIGEPEDIKPTLPSAGDYMRALHRGVQMELRHGSSDAGSPKKLRVDVLVLQAEVSALVELLIAQGVFTLDMYREMRTKHLYAQVGNQEARLCDVCHVPLDSIRLMD